jgi:hypothetical protein
MNSTVPVWANDKRGWCFAILLASVAAGTGCPPPAPTLRLTDLDPCIAAAEMVVTQGSMVEIFTIQPQAGSATVTLPEGEFNPQAEVGIGLTVTQWASDECRERFPSPWYLNFAGMPTPPVNGQSTVSAGDFTSYSEVSLPGAGDVGFGDRENPPPPPPNINGPPILIWFEPTQGGTCTAHSWEQWALTRVFLKRGDNAEEEIREGDDFNDANGNQHTYGEWGRDRNQPPANGYQQAPIPSLPIVSGVIDNPGFPPTAERRRQVYLFARAEQPQPQLPFKVIYRFSFKTILICEAPLPRRVVGYVTWSAEQVFHYSQGPGTQVSSTVDYKHERPHWTEGTAGLEPQMIP